MVTEIFDTLVNQLLPYMQFEQVKIFILNKLTEGLPRHLTYHSVDHVVDVYEAAEHIGTMEHISHDDRLLLLTAVLFHDSGFLLGPNAHEEESCKIANQYLPGYGYTGDQIKIIEGLIMATKIPHMPKNQLEEIICDSDLDYLGRDDFFPISNSLYLELKSAGIVNDENSWNKIQVSFFNSHHYFTKTALALRQKKKEEHLEQIKLKIR